MDLQLTDKAAIITGGSMGIGKAVAEGLAAEGCDVAIVARGGNCSRRWRRRSPNPAAAGVFPLVGDMRSSDDTNRVVDAAAEAFGGLDICVPNAGSSPGGLLEELTDDQWNQSLQLKFMGHVRTVRAAVPHLAGAGRRLDRHGRRQ